MRGSTIYITDILQWADESRRIVGRWPHRGDGRIPGRLGLTWNAVDMALTKGHRGLPRGWTLAKLLHEYRGIRHPDLLPRFTIKQILLWADDYKRRTRTWPTPRSGSITQSAGDTWMAVQRKLQDGGRGLKGGSSIAQVLEKHRGVRNRLNAPQLNHKKILKWVDAHHKRTGRWPTRFDGQISGSSGETWHSVHAALYTGIRGLPKGGSLARLLARFREVRNHKAPPPLTVKQVLGWAKAFHERTGKWPNHTSGTIPEAQGETWSSVHGALVRGRRGLPKGSSLYQVLWELRPKRKKH